MMGAIRELQSLYDPKSAMQPADDLQTLLSIKVPTDKNPQHALRDMLATAERLNKEGFIWYQQNICPPPHRERP